MSCAPTTESAPATADVTANPDTKHSSNEGQPGSGSPAAAVTTAATANADNKADPVNEQHGLIHKLFHHGDGDGKTTEAPEE